jgi:predicted transglutaminase-like cysteine proteinase
MTTFALRSANNWTLKLFRPAIQYSTALLISALIVTGAGPAEATRNDRFLQARMAISAPTAAQEICNIYQWACSVSGSRKKLTQDDIDLIRTVNRQVNRQIRQVSDKSQYRKVDYWTLPLSYRGDCEDIALMKKQQLVKAGIAPERLLLATVLDRKRNGHAVLVLRTDSGDYVLDNLTNNIMSWQSTRYTFLRMQNPDAPRNWIGLMVQG